MLKIILGLLEPTEGEVLLDGIDVRARGRSTMQNSVVAVMQDDSPMSGTVSENISFFGEVLDEDRVQRAAEAAGLHETIMRMPMQYQTLVGDLGASLSGGQRQRLLLARAIYRDPQIIVLDEATSHLDLLAEKLVNESIRQLKITRILVAHRPETILSADRFVALNHRSLVELDRGTVEKRIKAR